MRSISNRFTCPVVGVTFVEGYPDNLLDLAAVQRRRDHRAEKKGVNAEPLTAILIREPDNPHDANAIEVHVPSVGQIGHIPRQIAARLAPRLDAGETWQAHLEAVRISPEAPEQPGVDVRVRKVLRDATPRPDTGGLL